MSRLYEALLQMERQHRPAGAEPAQPMEFLDSVGNEQIEPSQASSVKAEISATSHLVALTDPKSLGAEKFRSLATRLENLRVDRELKSLQVTSSVINEGKTLVAGNLAVTLAKYSGCKVLLVEGDLHRPALASLFGLTQLPGVSHWWSGKDESISRHVHQLSDMPLWFLSAGGTCDEPSQILQSARFVRAFHHLVSTFGWIIVDSTPMLPTVVANLWSRLVDGMLLVVREGVAPVKTLKKGFDALDNAKLVGIVLNETSDFDWVTSVQSYFATQKQARNGWGRKHKPEGGI
jgi:capsular exopolysaccharide synthesis family protein